MAFREYCIRVDEETLFRMFFNNRLCLQPCWPEGQANDFLWMIYAKTFDDLLAMTDSFDYSVPLDSNYVPQFADMKAVDNAVDIIGSSGETVLTYRELGYYLIREDRKNGAYRKYGENHGKGASLLGLALFNPGEFRRSCLTQAYNQLPTSEVRSEIRKRIYLRIPFVQYTLFRAKNDRYNAYDSIRMFTVGTMERRGQSPRKILEDLHDCGNAELNRRINNIYWQA